MKKILLFITSCSCQFEPFDSNQEISPINMPPLEACENFPNGFLPPLKRLNITEHFTGNLRDQVQKFMLEMPKELFDRLALGHVIVDATNGKLIPSKDHHFFPWLIEELQSVMVYNWNTHNKIVFRSFEFIMPLLDEVHEFRIRAEISQYLNSQIEKGLISVYEKYRLMNKYLKLIEETPMVQYSSFRSPKTGYFREMNNLVIPDNYMLNFKVWCDEIQPQVILGIEKYPWQQKEEIVFWRGKLTGMNLDYFPVGYIEHNPGPKKIRELVLEDPLKWQRVYLCYLAASNPSFLDAKLTDVFPLHSQLMGFNEHGWHYRAAEIKVQREAKSLHHMMENLDQIQTTQGWRKVFCGREFKIHLAKDQVYHLDPEYEIYGVMQDLVGLAF